MKLCSPNEKKNNTSIPEFFYAISTGLNTLGLDTVFRVPNADWTAEIYLAKEWGQVTNRLVKPWIAQLKTGVLNKQLNLTHPVCPYDVQNLMNSGSYLLGSVTVHYHKELKLTLGETPDGSTVLVYLMQS